MHDDLAPLAKMFMIVVNSSSEGIAIDAHAWCKKLGDTIASCALRAYYQDGLVSFDNFYEGETITLNPSYCWDYAYFYESGFAQRGFGLPASAMMFLFTEVNDAVEFKLRFGGRNIVGGQYGNNE